MRQGICCRVDEFDPSLLDVVDDKMKAPNRSGRRSIDRQARAHTGRTCRPWRCQLDNPHAGRWSHVDVRNEPEPLHIERLRADDISHRDRHELSPSKSVSAETSADR